MANKGDALPLVSIIIPTRNRRELLSRAIGSARSQTWPRIELVVVDDGSTDGTRDWIGSLQGDGPPLLYCRNETTLGPCAARNRGIREAQGEFICLLDDDDAFHPRRIERLMQVLLDKPGLSFVCSDFLSIRRNGERRSRKAGRIDLRRMLWMNYATQSVLAQREHVLAVGGFDGALSAAQDYDLFTRLIERFGSAFRIGEVLYYYHQEHEAPRITATRSKRLWGYYGYYLKHKHLMTRRQRAWHLYRLLRIRGRKTGLARFVTMVPPRFYLLELNDFFIHHTSLYLWLNRLRKALRT